MKQKKVTTIKVAEKQIAARPNTPHEYDIDIINSSQLVSRIFDKQNKIFEEFEIDTEDILIAYATIMQEIEEYCKTIGIDSTHYSNNGMSVIVDWEKPCYEDQLAYTLLWFDINKIDRLLEYQKKNYNGKENFVERIEFHVYKSVERNLILIEEKIVTEEKRLEKIMNWVKSTQAIKKKDELTEDNRIKGKLSKEEIEKYFMQLTDFPIKEKRIQVLTPVQVKHFLQANFSGFDPRTEIEKFDTPKLTQTKLQKFIRDFYHKHSTETRTGEYITLLKNNFSRFDNPDIDSVRSNFSK